MASDFPIIDKLGGRDATHEKLRKLGHDVGPDALRMWVVRGSIPGDAVRFLMRIADKEQVRYSARDFELARSTA